MGAPARNFGLDVLRCLSIVLVLANHAFLGFFIELGGVAWTGPKAFASILSFISIEWLFVLSGFLIGAMMIRSFEKEPTWWLRARSFWLRRWFRTLPNYYLFLAVNAGLAASGFVPFRFVGEFDWRHLLFAQNLAWRESLPLFFNESWSLALDEWFYLALPILVGVGSRVAGATGRRAFLLATTALIAVPTVLRLAMPMPATPFDWDLGVRRITLYHLDATGWGVLAAITSRWHPGFWARQVRRKAALGLVLCVAGILALEEMFFQFLVPGGLGWSFFTVWPRLPVAFALTLTGAGTFLAFPWVAGLRPPSGALARGAETLSNYTYSIYLSHFPLLYILAGVLPDAAPLPRPLLWSTTALWLVLVLGVSAAVYHAFEKPVSDLRDRYTKKVDARPFLTDPPS